MPEPPDIMWITSSAASAVRGSPPRRSRGPTRPAPWIRLARQTAQGAIAMRNLRSGQWSIGPRVRVISPLSKVRYLAVAWPRSSDG